MHGQSRCRTAAAAWHASASSARGSSRWRPSTAHAAPAAPAWSGATSAESARGSAAATATAQCQAAAAASLTPQAARAPKPGTRAAAVRHPGRPMRGMTGSQQRCRSPSHLPRLMPAAARVCCSCWQPRQRQGWEAQPQPPCPWRPRLPQPWACHGGSWLRPGRHRRLPCSPGQWQLMTMRPRHRSCRRCGFWRQRRRKASSLPPPPAARQCHHHQWWAAAPAAAR